MSDRDQTPSEVDFKRQWDAAEEHQREEWAWQMFDALNESLAPVEPVPAPLVAFEMMIREAHQRLTGAVPFTFSTRHGYGYPTDSIDKVTSLLGNVLRLLKSAPVPAPELFATKDEVDEWMNRARDEGYWEGWSDGQDVLKGDLMVTLDRIQGECDSEEWQTKCLHKCVEMLAHPDDIPPDGPCLVWSPICRDCGAEVPAGAE